MTIGFIGAGNMAGAIIRGVLASGFASSDEIMAYDVRADQLAELAGQTGLRQAASNTDLATQADIIVLAVKPNVIGAVVEQIKAILAQRKPLLVSIAAGTPLAKLAAWTGPDIPTVRVMPNINAIVRQAVSALCANEAASRQQIDDVAALFGAVGTTIELPESQFRAFMAIAGASPAWTYLYIDSLARGALKAGMPKAQALAVAAQAVLGSAAMVAASDQHPWELIDTVCSPGGTTIAGLESLEAGAFGASIVQAVEATIRRDEEISSL